MLGKETPLGVQLSCFAQHDRRDSLWRPPMNSVGGVKAVTVMIKIEHNSCMHSKRSVLQPDACSGSV